MISNDIGRGGVDSARTRASAATKVGGAWLGRGWLVVILLGLGGCPKPEPPKPPEPTDVPAQKAAVEQQLTNAAEKTKAWSDEDERTFRRNLIGLTSATRFEVSKRLATLINTNVIKVARTPSYKVDVTCPTPCRAVDDAKPPAPANPGLGGSPAPAPTRAK